jgi:GntR family transcriptional regulator
MKLKISIDGDSDIPIFQQIVNELEGLILIGKIQEGEFLPSVREFAVQHSVNPNTVSKAYQALQSLDIVESIRGTGLRAKRLKSSKSNQRRMEILKGKATELIELAEKLEVTPNELVTLVKNLGKEVKS